VKAVAEQERGNRDICPGYRRKGGKWWRMEQSQKMSSNYRQKSLIEHMMLVFI